MTNAQNEWLMERVFEPRLVDDFAALDSGSGAKDVLRLDALWLPTSLLHDMD